MGRKIMIKRKMILFISIGGLCMLLIFLLWWRGREKGGTVLCPGQERELPDMVYFCQKDSRWAGEHLGAARDTMASSGCLVCALTAGLDMQAKNRGLDFYMTAGELNEAFSDADVYTENGAVIWGKVSEAVPGTESYVADRVDAAEIDALLEDGIFPVVKVRMEGVGAWHWVLLTGADENGYLCMDPMSEEEEPVPLSGFRDRAYSVRAVYFAE